MQNYTFTETEIQKKATALLEKDLNKSKTALLELIEPTPEVENYHVTRCSQLFEHSQSSVVNEKKNATLKTCEETIIESEIPDSQVPVFHELAVPFFGVTPIQIEQALLQFVAELISRKSMFNVRRLIFIPVGLPGMGKSTLAKHIREAVQNNLQGGLSNGSKFEEYCSQRSFKDENLSGNKRDHQKAFEEESQLRANIINGKVFPDVDFKKISYDRILGSNVNQYASKHPETPFHEIIDIIRAKTDQDYLDQISAEGSVAEIQNTDAAALQLDSQNVTGLSQSNLTRNRVNHSRLPAGRSIQNLPKSIIYCDRNNTPDVWADIRDTILKSNDACLKDYRTVVLLPKQEPWDKKLYRMRNPICPHLIFECCKRIFSRKEHGCLSGANKPKAVEVVLKFTKLHDGFDFDDQPQVKHYFDDVLTLDFMKYSERAKPLLPETIEGMISGYNETPENFGVPSDETINQVIRLIDMQMAKDEKDEAEAKARCQYVMTQNKLSISNKDTDYEPRMHGSTMKWLSPAKEVSKKGENDVNKITDFAQNIFDKNASRDLINLKRQKMASTGLTSEELDESSKLISLTREQPQHQD